MSIIFSQIYEREGNDAWLKDLIQIHHNELGLYIDHKQRWSGWSGEIKEDNTIDLDIDDLDESQKIIDKYIDDNSLFRTFPNGDEEGIKINLKEIISQ